MYKIALFVLCAQALLIQNVFGQSLCGQSNQGLVGYGGINQIVSSGYGNSIAQSNGGFGGNGVGQLGIAGEMPIAGNTFLEGNLPVVGVVGFDGLLPALGFVTIAGSTPCQCGGYSGIY